jgi:hypothetical protein
MVRSTLARCLFATILLAGTAFSEAADIQIERSPAGEGIVAIRGAIKRGDAFRLKRVLGHAPNDKTPSYVIVTISVNSPGGDAGEAMAMADIVGSIFAPVVVEGDGLCTGACFLVWLAGSPHMARSLQQIEASRTSGVPSYFGAVGLHGPNPPAVESSSNNEEKVLREVREHLENKHVPRRLIDTMLGRSSSDIYWMTKEDLSELGQYPPDVEEYLIRKCNYRRDGGRAAKSNEELLAQFEAVQQVKNCELSSLGEMRKGRQADLDQ